MFVNGKPYGFYENFNAEAVDNQNNIKISSGFNGEIGETVLYERPLFNTETHALVNDTERLKEGIPHHACFPTTDQLPLTICTTRMCLLSSRVTSLYQTQR